MEPEWEIGKEEFLKRLGCSEYEFAEYLSLPKIRNIGRIVPLKHLRTVASLVPISLALLGTLLRRVRTINGELPFRNAKFELSHINPGHCSVGQMFVYRENYQHLLEKLSSLFGTFAIPAGITQLGAYFVFGEDRNGTVAMACYLPPIIERHETLVVMDGIHRNYLAKQLGTTLCSIVASNVSVPFPCEPHEWRDVGVIGTAEKPREINDRYFGLRKELFRDLKYLGIDG